MGHHVTTPDGPATTTDTRVIEVWFGKHVVASHTAQPDDAAHYAALMRRRFAGLRVTITPTNEADPTTPIRPLPTRALWDRGPA